MNDLTFKPHLTLERNNAGETFIALTEFTGEMPTHTIVISMACNGMPVDRIMRKRFDVLSRMIPCTSEDLLPDATS